MNRGDEIRAFWGRWVPDHPFARDLFLVCMERELGWHLFADVIYPQYPKPTTGLLTVTAVIANYFKYDGRLVLCAIAAKHGVEAHVRYRPYSHIVLR